MSVRRTANVPSTDITFAVVFFHLANDTCTVTLIAAFVPVFVLQMNLSPPSFIEFRNGFRPQGQVVSIGAMHRFIKALSFVTGFDFANIKIFHSHALETSSSTACHICLTFGKAVLGIDVQIINGHSLTLVNRNGPGKCQRQLPTSGDTVILEFLFKLARCNHTAWSIKKLDEGKLSYIVHHGKRCFVYKLGEILDFGGQLQIVADFVDYFRIRGELVSSLWDF